jgi:type IV pilus assembly protein PilV
MFMKRAALRSQLGVGIVEVLVAVLVLSIGLLGLAGLQMRTLRNSESSMSRGIAVVETHAIADAMRADRANAIQNGAFEIALEDDPPVGDTFAETALAAWRENLVNSLGEGATGSVECDAADGSLCTITIQWNDTRGSGDAAELEEFQIVTEVQL